MVVIGNVGDVVSPQLTYEDYCQLPPDGRRYQLVEGELFVTPAPATAHQRVSRNLEFVLIGHVKEHKLGVIYDAPIDVILDNQTVVQPDILFVSRERIELVSDRGIEGAPDLVVEILSPRTQKIDRTTKLRVYARAGVQHIWLP